jgi:hypothetical protein
LAAPELSAGETMGEKLLVDLSDQSKECAKTENMFDNHNPDRFIGILAKGFF